MARNPAVARLIDSASCADTDNRGTHRPFRSVPAVWRGTASQRVYSALWLFLALAGLLVSTAGAVAIQLDYSYDTEGFFANQAAKDTLEFAVQAFEPFTDQLLAIQPGGSNHWTAFFTAPGSGESVQEADLQVPGNTLVVFVGGRDLEGGQVGLGGPGGWSASGNFAATVRDRGQGETRGTAAMDFGPWGGALAFDTIAPNGTARAWHFDVNTEPSFGQADLLSVAMHELGHMFGFGISDSYGNQIVDGPDLNDSYFIGQTVKDLALTDPKVPGVAVDEIHFQNTVFHDHWVSGTTSPPYLNPPPAAMGPTLALGSRVPLTPLDYAALKDTGWEVPGALLGLPGDLDGDRDVDGEDFLGWQHRIGMTSGVSLVLGDANGDGNVDHYDGWIVRNNLGAKALVASRAAQVPVPEPTTADLCLTLGCLFNCLKLQRMLKLGEILVPR